MFRSALFDRAGRTKVWPIINHIPARVFNYQGCILMSFDDLIDEFQLFISLNTHAALQTLECVNRLLCW